MPIRGVAVLAGSPVVAFVGVADLDRAAAFYGDLLGLALADERPYALVASAGPATLRITAVGTPAGAGYTVLGWQVADLAGTVRGLAGRGVPFVHYDGMGQDGQGIWDSPSGARVAWFTDPDGNLLSLTQPATGAPA